MSSTLGVLIREARERARLTQASREERLTSQPASAVRGGSGSAETRDRTTLRRCELRIELEQTSSQRRAAAAAALARSVEDRLRTNDAFTRFAAELRRG